MSTISRRSPLGRVMVMCKAKSRTPPKYHVGSRLTVPLLVVGIGAA
jgi:hypothetical protein